LSALRACSTLLSRTNTCKMFPIVVAHRESERLKSSQTRISGLYAVLARAPRVPCRSPAKVELPGQSHEQGAASAITGQNTQQYRRRWQRDRSRSRLQS
jgi:hypothetical protein